MPEDFSLSDIQNAEYLSRERQDIQELPDTFYVKARRYTDALDADRPRETAEQALRTLAEQRYDKLRERATLGVNVDERQLSDEEREVHAKLHNGGVDAETAVSMLVTTNATDDVDRLEVRLLEDLPPIAGLDGRTYESLQREDVVALPRRNAEALVDKDAAKRVQAESDDEPEPRADESGFVTEAIGVSD